MTESEIKVLAIAICLAIFAVAFAVTVYKWDGRG